jgi:hypothetical protein
MAKICCEGEIFGIMAYAYPECPYADTKNVCAYNDPNIDCICRHKKARWHKCISHSYMDADESCPFNLHEELYGNKRNRMRMT